MTRDDTLFYYDNPATKKKEEKPQRKSSYCRDCKHMATQTSRRKYDSDRYTGKFPEGMDTLAVPIFVLTILLCGLPVAIFFVITFTHNLFKKSTESVCMRTAEEDLVNGGRKENTARRCKDVRVELPHCDHYEEKPTIEQEIEESLAALREIRKFKHEND